MFHLFFHFFRRLRTLSDGEALKVLLAVFVTVCYSTSGFMFFEIQDKPDLTWADALWWSFVTMTTVGYGDYFPSSNFGRFAVGLPTMVFGIGILGYLLSTVATYLIESRSKELKGMKQIKETEHILLVHFNDLNWVVNLVHELQEDPSTRDKPIVLIDNELEELPGELDALGVRFVKGNPARQATMEHANVQGATHAVVLSKNPQDVRSDDLNLAVAMTIESLKPEIHTVAECVDAESIEVLRRTGCDSVVCASRLSSSLLVQELLDPGVQDVVEELTSVRMGQQLFVLPIDGMKEWKLEELQAWLSAREMLFVGIKRGDKVILNPRPGLAIEREDRVIFIGETRPPSVVTAE